MRRALPVTLLFCLLILVPAVPAAHGQTAQDLLDSGQLIVRTRLEPEGEVLVGQKVILWIEILTSTWFTSAPQLPQALEIANAIVVRPDSFGVNLSERIGGATFAGQARRYLVFPQRAGTIETPPVPLALTVALESGGSSPELRLEAPPGRFRTRRPPGSEGLGPVLAAPELRVSEQWDPAPGELKVGDSITRRIEVTIDDAVAMLLPPLETETVEGLGLYPGKPEISDRANRGQLTGTRVDTVTWIMEQEGTYELPELVYHWWDLERQELRREVLPAVTLTVLPNPDLAADHLGEKPAEGQAAARIAVEEEDSGTGLRNAAAVVAVLILLLFVFRRRIARIPAALAGRRRRRSEGEARYFERFRRAAATGDAGRTMAALMAWLDRFIEGSGTATLQRFVDRSGDPELAAETASLTRSAYGRSPDGTAPAWSGRRLARLAARARKTIQSRDDHRPMTPGPLPPLNP